MRLATRLAPLFLALAFVSLVAACGDDDGGASPGGGSDLEVYFAGLDDVFERADNESDDAQTGLDDALQDADGLEEEVAAVQDYLDATVATFNNATEGIAALDPPAEATGAQADFIEAAEGSRDLAASLKADLAGIETREEADQLVVDFNEESQPFVEQGDQACLELQQVADDNDVDVDLGCTG